MLFSSTVFFGIFAILHQVFNSHLFSQQKMPNLHLSAVQMKMSVSVEEPTLHWKRKTTMTYYTHILTSFLKPKVAAYIKNTAFLDFAKRKTYFYNFQ